MAHSVRTKTAGLTTITLSDAGDVNELVIPGLIGDFTCDVPAETINQHKENGKFASAEGGIPDLSTGEENECTFSFSGHLQDTVSDDYATILGAALRAGIIEDDWVSTLGANHPVKTLRAKFVIDGSAYAEDDLGMRFRHCILRMSLSNGVDGWKFSISGVSHEVAPENLRIA